MASEGSSGLRKGFLSHLNNGTSTSYVEPEDQYTGNSTARKVLEATIRYFYEHLGGGSYEELYDTLIQLKEGTVPDEFTAICRELGLATDADAEDLTKDWSYRLHQGLFMAEKIFNQILGQILTTQSEDFLLPCYGKFCRLLARFSKTNDFWIHTLNHDLFLESLMDGSRDFTYGVDYSEGFEELGSPFYGDYGGFKVRLRRYTGQYAEPVRLYKLHGSMDYWLFRENGPERGHYPPTVVQKNDVIAPYELYREVEKNGKLQYDRDITNYHPLFLSGVEYKKRWYEYPHFFQKLLADFRDNLTKSDVLVIIGYGFKDEGINELLADSMNDPDKKVLIIDKYPIIHSLVREEMLRLGGLEAFDFKELEGLLDAPRPAIQIIGLYEE